MQEGGCSGPRADRGHRRAITDPPSAAATGRLGLEVGLRFQQRRTRHRLARSGAAVRLVRSEWLV